MSNNNTIIWDVDQQKVILTLTGHTNRVEFVKMLSDAQTLVSTSDDWTIKLWNVYNGTLKKTLTGHNGSVYCAEQLKNGYLVSASADGTIKVWNLTNYSVVQTISNAHNSGNVVTGLRLLANGNLASSGSDYNIRIWNTTALPYTQLSILSGHTNIIWDLELLSNGGLASASLDQTVKIWNTTSGQLITSFNPLNSPLYYAQQVSSNPIILACVGITNKLVYYNTKTNTNIQTNTLSFNTTVALLVYNSTIMFAGGSGATQMQICYLNNYTILGSSYVLAAGNPTVLWLEKLSMRIAYYKKYILTIFKYFIYF